MHALDALADPVRRRILELLTGGERDAGYLTAAIRAEFGISQPATSRHLRLLRQAGLTRARADGRHRHYAVAPEGVREAEQWLDQFHSLWAAGFDALRAEVTREDGQSCTLPSRSTGSSAE
ncbi:ArsR/SmtB family transcription factor [Paractinoplanes rishiriensis]|uniref:Transcriptional regulator n=1 Tax=Paractinoplanes rishiriensis TaxID=1050105 RepID=A0A919JZN5_9ACTN|nr:metalloregulator ArsR/SmtB family transcription factor [Actinoplanes rishiriensis]GIE97648.1 transcriptional regulator [Actinoplanes rishiriensis]